MRATASGLLIPGEYEVPLAAYRCTVCQADFPAEQRETWQLHVGACARANMDAIHAASPAQRAKGGPFDPENWDKEADDYLLNVIGPRMRREGRWEIKSHERVS